MQLFVPRVAALLLTRKSHVIWVTEEAAAGLSVTTGQEPSVVKIVFSIREYKAFLTLWCQVIGEPQKKFIQQKCLGLV